MSNEPPLSLEYQTVPPRQMTPVLRAAWITLLVVGSLTALGGLCLGGSTIFAMYMVISTSRHGGGTTAPVFPSSVQTIMLITSIIVTALPLAFGSTQIICSLKVRRFSMPAVITAIVTLGVEILGILVLLGLGVAGALMNPSHDLFAALIGLTFYLAIGLTFGAAEFLLIKSLPDVRAQRTRD